MITDKMFKKGKFWTHGPMVVTGCTKVSPGCKNCWSEKAHVMRSKGPNSHIWPADCLTDKHFNGRVHFNLRALENAVKGKKPQVIAVWNDMYHEGVSFEDISNAFKCMYGNMQHAYLIITKRPERAVEYLNHGSRIVYSHGKSTYNYPDNIIHIATMENQARADERMTHLLKIPGKRGIIIEPMLGPVDINEIKGYWGGLGIHQVILGPENGTGKRYMNPEWTESVKAQCEGAGVPFYRKDTGEGELVWR